MTDEPDFETMWDKWADAHMQEPLGYLPVRSANEIREWYAQRHPPRVTAEDVAKEWKDSADERFDDVEYEDTPATWGVDSTYKALMVGAQREADRRSGEADQQRTLTQMDFDRRNTSGRPATFPTPEDDR